MQGLGYWYYYTRDYKSPFEHLYIVEYSGSLVAAYRPIFTSYKFYSLAEIQQHMENTLGISVHSWKQIGYGRRYITLFKGKLFCITDIYKRKKE